MAWVLQRKRSRSWSSNIFIKIFDALHLAWTPGSNPQLPAGSVDVHWSTTSGNLEIAKEVMDCHITSLLSTETAFFSSQHQPCQNPGMADFNLTVTSKDYQTYLAQILTPVVNAFSPVPSLVFRKTVTRIKVEIRWFYRSPITMIRNRMT